MKDKIELITAYLQDNEVLVDLVYDLLNLGGWPNKHDLIKFSRVKIKTYDTATPINYYRKIEEIYPGFSAGCYVYNYTENTFGEFLNINNLVVKRILSDLNKVNK